LIDFYDMLDGTRWRNNDNWLTGDPCLNHWHGVGCNTAGNIISLHFFENHLVGSSLPDSFANLVHLRHLSIFNAEREFEGEENMNANTIELLPYIIFECVLLEELNLVHLDMKGRIPAEMGNLAQLKYMNLSNNRLASSIVQGDEWKQMTKLKMIELQNNVITGFPDEWKYLPELIYVNMSNNTISTEAILTSA
jgi:hypothetical protein